MRVYAPPRVCLKLRALTAAGTPVGLVFCKHDHSPALGVFRCINDALSCRFRIAQLKAELALHIAPKESSVERRGFRGLIRGRRRRASRAEAASNCTVPRAALRIAEGTIHVLVITAVTVEHEEQPEQPEHPPQPHPEQPEQPVHGERPAPRPYVAPSAPLAITIAITANRIELTFMFSLETLQKIL